MKSSKRLAGRKIGSYYLGNEAVDLCALPDSDGGSFWCCPAKGKPALIQVGFRPEWSTTVSFLLHEATELAYYRLALRFAPTPDYANEHSGYLFVMRHADFSEATARVAMLVADALPDLAKAWMKWKKAQK